MSEGDWKTFMGVLGLFKGWLVTPSQALPHPAVITKSLEDVLKGDGDDDLSEIPL